MNRSAASKRPGAAVARAALAGLLALACAWPAAAPRGAAASNPAVPGDHPDPSVIRVGADYWATSTSSEWGPEIPILRSRDLVDWRQVGTVFATRPAWSDANYWAPEITRVGGRFLIYYVGHKKGG